MEKPSQKTLCVIQCFRIKSTILVPSKLTFSENLRCLNLALMLGAVSQNRSLPSTCIVIAGQSIPSGKFKHLKYSENVNFEGTNSVDSILMFVSNTKSCNEDLLAILTHCKIFHFFQYLSKQFVILIDYCIEVSPE